MPELFRKVAFANAVKVMKWKNLISQARKILF